MQCIAATRLAAPLRKPCTVSRRAARKVAVVKAVAFPSEESVKESAADATAALQAKAQEYANYAQAKWEASENKPAIVATGAGALVALYIISGIINTVDHLPLLNKVFELVGLGVSAWFAYRWFFVAGERESIMREVSKVANKVGLDL